MKMILLVKDAMHLAAEIADIIRMDGYLVMIANSTMRGLEILLNYRPDLIITDHLMPGTDGFEFIQQVRSMGSFKLVPIIILSAKISEADRLRGKEVGADAFVGMPCHGKELIAAIEALIK